MKFSKMIGVGGGALLPSGAILMGALVLASVMATSSAQAQSASPTGMTREWTMMTNPIRTLKNAIKSKSKTLENELNIEINKLVIKITKLTPPTCPESEISNWKGSSWQCEKISNFIEEIDCDGTQLVDCSKQKSPNWDSI